MKARKTIKKKPAQPAGKKAGKKSPSGKPAGQKPSSKKTAAVPAEKKKASSSRPSKRGAVSAKKPVKKKAPEVTASPKKKAPAPVMTVRLSRSPEATPSPKEKAPARKTPYKKVSGTRRAVAEEKTVARPAVKKAVSRTRPVRPADQKKKRPARKGNGDFPVPSITDLPGEYGEDDLIAIVVDPHTVFAHWEVTRESIGRREKGLRLRVYDVTVGGNGSGQKRDIRISERVGSGFFSLEMPGREALMSIGTLGPGGRFRPIATTGRLSMPAGTADEEFVSETERPASGRVGY